MRRLLPIVALAVSVLPAATADAKVKWLCRAGMHDVCDTSLATTVYSPSGHRVAVRHPQPTARKVDCFYVYPTVSDQTTTFATKRVDPEIRSIALFQAARFNQVCRVFAPVYRQTTIAGIQPAVSGGGARNAPTKDIAQDDVREAWHEYLRRYNHGRGVVLIGHSQGAFRLQQLIRSQIERRAAVRRRLLSAILLGGNVTVRKGRDRGGVFRRLRACRSETQLHCVVAFSTFDEPPPADARFGRIGSRLARVFRLPTGNRYEVLCTNPARLAGGSAALDLITPSKPFAPGSLIAAGISILGLPYPQASTPWVEAPAAFTGRCSGNVLLVRPAAGTPDPKPSPDATWGLHLLDANIALGDLLDLVRAQAREYARSR
jgi:Protein of unknown function (DUF3089)